jgi:hypothetical protein
MSKVLKDGLGNVENDLTWDKREESNYSGMDEDTRPYFFNHGAEELKPSPDQEEPRDLYRLFEEDGTRDGGPLFRQGEAEQLFARWVKIEAGFSDDPLATVKDSHALLLEVVQRILVDFSSNPALLEADNKQEISVEDLRITLKRYEAFFDRLLASKAW